jgi:hypothetical protein
MLFVVHSCICSAANWPDIHEHFRRVDPECLFYAFNQQTHYREYFFVALKDVESATRMFDAISNTKPSWLRQGTMLFHCLYADNCKFLNLTSIINGLGFQLVSSGSNPTYRVSTLCQMPFQKRKVLN